MKKEEKKKSGYDNPIFLDLVGYLVRQGSYMRYTGYGSEEAV